jgi:hypothetical protein
VVPSSTLDALMFASNPLTVHAQDSAATRALVNPRSDRGRLFKGILAFSLPNDANEPHFATT